ncbi:MAG: hypothetical protein LBJ17_02715 [Dysgonamonadaceae bacterium]|jgi:hypothetical protein|nr:hypothetical protein [Dysgonamonadaceae bacterium]
MDIKAKIKDVSYKVMLAENLKKNDAGDFNINISPAYCLVQNGNNSFAISKWVSPKRTRSYPYERVYNTLNTKVRITVIPIIKDEGKDGERDFIQWDTVSLMSLLNVFVIFAYYDKATKNHNYHNKITDFKFDNDYVISKIKEIEQCHSSALHWNLNELKTNLHSILDKAKESYEIISKESGVELHDFKGINNFKEKIGKEVETFMQFSRGKAERAQTREIVTTQPKESLATLTKAKITITNYLGGQYFFTVDEVEIHDNTVYLIEGKHSKNSILPGKGDIKDGLLKMILYSNLSEVEVNGRKMKCKAVLKLTSKKLHGSLCSFEEKTGDRVKFFSENKMSQGNLDLIDTLFKEAKSNGFTVKTGFAK